MFTVPGNRDIEPPREGESILRWAIEATRRLNRRIHGRRVVESFGDILITEPEIPSEPPHGRFKLTEDLYPCNHAAAVQIFYDANGNVTVGGPLTIYDPEGKVGSFNLLCRQDAAGDWYMPAGTCGDWTFQEDTGHDDVDSFGDCCSPGGFEPPTECGVPCCPTGESMQWMSLSDLLAMINSGSDCKVLVCCPGGNGSGSGGCPPLSASYTMSGDLFDVLGGQSLNGAVFTQTSPSQWIATVGGVTYMLKWNSATGHWTIGSSADDVNTIGGTNLCDPTSGSFAGDVTFWTGSGTLST